MSTKPKASFPKARGFIPTFIPETLPDPQLRPEHFDTFIKNNGIRFLHQKAALCPNVSNLDVENHDPNCKKCRNGHIFSDPLVVWGIFQQSRLEKMFEVTHEWIRGTAMVTFTSFAVEDNEESGDTFPIEFEYFDRVKVIDFTFRFNELVEHSPTGIDRLRFDALQVDFLSTKDKDFKFGIDFTIDKNYNIKWISSNRPRIDMLNDTGEIYTITYHANPVFYVVNIMHEIRATKVDNKALRLPQLVLLGRDFLMEDKTGDDVGAGNTLFPRDSSTVFPG